MSALAAVGARHTPRPALLALICAAAVAVVLAGAPPARAASPWWRLSSGSRPTALQPEGEGKIVISAANLGDESADGKLSPVSITDKLPAGVKVVECPKEKQKPGCGIEGLAGEPEGLAGNRGPVECPVTKPLGQTLTCTFAGTFEREGNKHVPKILPPFDQIEIVIEVEVVGQPEPAELQNEVHISGGQAPDASISRALTVGGEEAFGIENFEMSPEEEGGAPATQAGKHPFQVTGSVTVDQTEGAEPVVLAKELNARLPAGLIGNPTPLPQCTLGQFLTITAFLENQCPSQSVVGVAMATINERGVLGLTTFTVPIFNVEPSQGEPARFGLYLPGTPVFLDPSVRTGSDYGVTLSSTNISQTAALLSARLTFWGVPGDHRHDSERGIGCIEAAQGLGPPSACKALQAQDPPPFLSLPTSCTGPLTSSIEARPWPRPGEAPKGPLIVAGQPMAAMDGCNRLSFTPSIKVTPDGNSASTPTGLNVDVHVPQDSVAVANGLAESNVKAITVTLPGGVAINPAGADGLLACSGGLVGFTGFLDLPGAPHTPTFTPTLPDPLQQGINFCPDAAKVATVTIHSPLLPRPLIGSVYLATQNENPFGSLIAMYIVARDDVSGTLVKLPGQVSLSESGQITATFNNNPQLAFEDAEVHFFGGQRAPLATPDQCATYTTNATLAPWSGNQPVSAQSAFAIATGPNGAPCPPPGLPFSPTLTGGSTNIQAGAFTPFTTTISRPDGNQPVGGITMHMPPGLSGILSGVALCGESQANAGTCGPQSQIGETTVSVGVGSDPFSVTGGKVYITGPYQGAPFGLSIVNPAKAGPFDIAKELGPTQKACDCIIVRAKLDVDPNTAALTVSTDKSGPYAIPTILAGIPLQIKHVSVTITRPGFTFNPTNCAPQAITASISSAQGASSAQSVPFQVTNCATLAFAPKFSVSTSGKPSRAKGASLKVKLAYPKAPFGSQANIASVKVELPKQLPSRLTTLQKACTAKQFEANPAGCPPASRIGSATATTPLLPVPLSGPAYFVSHGGEAFPSLIVVLQGYGVTVDLVGTTFINKKGITSSTFKTVPDVPVGTFELTLPQGNFSALAANGSLCPHIVSERKRVKGKMRTVRRSVAVNLTMPTIFTAQNGAVLKQSTKISVSGCAKVKGKGKGKKARKGKK